MFTSGSFKNEVAVMEERPRTNVNLLERTVALVPRWSTKSKNTTMTIMVFSVQKSKMQGWWVLKLPFVRCFCSKPDQSRANTGWRWPLPREDQVALRWRVVWEGSKSNLNGSLTILPKTFGFRGTFQPKRGARNASHNKVYTKRVEANKFFSKTVPSNNRQIDQL